MAFDMPVSLFDFRSRLRPFVLGRAARPLWPGRRHACYDPGIYCTGRNCLPAYAEADNSPRVSIAHWDRGGSRAHQPFAEFGWCAHRPCGRDRTDHRRTKLVGSIGVESPLAAARVEISE